MLLGVDTSVLTATKSSPRKFAPLTALFVTSAASVFLASSALRDEQFPRPEHRWDLEHLRHSNTRTAAAIPFLGRQQLSRPEVGVGQQQNCSVRSSRLLNSQAPRYPNTPSPARASKVLGVLRVLFAPPKHQVSKLWVQLSISPDLLLPSPYVNSKLFPSISRRSYVNIQT